MPYLVKSKRSQEAPVVTWTQGRMGDEVGTMTEVSATSVTLATQSTNDPDNGLVAYQTVSSGDIQLICQIPSSWTGGPENFTFFGLQLRETLNSDSVMLMNAWPNTGLARTKHRLTTGGSLNNNYATGLSGQTLPRYLAITYDDSASSARYWESADNISWFPIGNAVSVSLNYDVFCCIYGTSHDLFNEVTATITNMSLTSTITITDAGNPGPRNVLYFGEYPNGTFEEPGAVVGGHRIRTLPEPQTGSETTVIVGGDDGDGNDTRLVTSITPPTNGAGTGVLMSPDYQTNGAWTQLDKTKDYTGLNGGALDKPRSSLSIGDNGDENELTWGDQWLLGFVIHLPNNWQINTEGRRVMFLQCQSVGASWTQFTLEHVPAEGIGGGDCDDWILKWNVNPLSVRDNDTGNNQTDTVLDSIDDDIGVSTAFVMRFTFNPFSSATNPANAGITDGKDELFPGNGGGMEVWKEVGAGRTWTKVFSRVSQPFGTVPHATNNPSLSPRLYIPNMKTHMASITGPQGCMFEAWHFGRPDIHGTSWSDVSADRSNEP